MDLNKKNTKEEVRNTSSSRNSSTPIYDTLKRNYPHGEFPKDKEKCIIDTVDHLLVDDPNSKEPCLLLGKIQCGKTDTFEKIVALAFDRKIDLTVVLTKGTNTLASQTIKRLREDLKIFKNTVNEIKVEDILNVYKPKTGKNPLFRKKLIIVCKKEAKNLEHLITMFSKTYPELKQKNVLIVDDEADFASRNYIKQKTEPTVDDNVYSMAKISEQIDEFRGIPQYCTYLQVTATPYCLYLQPDGTLNLDGKTVKPFKPRFTAVVPTHDKYIGGQQYFVDSKNEESIFYNLFVPIPQKCIEILGKRNNKYLANLLHSELISGLKKMLLTYFVSTAVRRIQERNAYLQTTDDTSILVNYCTSALIHCEVSKSLHSWQEELISAFTKFFEENVDDESRSDKRFWDLLNYIIEDLRDSNTKLNTNHKDRIKSALEFPSESDILEELRYLLHEDHGIFVINSEKDKEEYLDEETGQLKLENAANIFIGGSILDRGITIDHLISFFYGRDPRKFQQDTVLQHARMYGARSYEDMSVTRFYTTEHIYSILERINELDDELRNLILEGNGETENTAVFVGYDSEVKPCSPSKILISNVKYLNEKQKAIVPVGFDIKPKGQVEKIVEETQRLIEKTPGHTLSDFFMIEYDRVVEIINKIKETYVYKSDINDSNDLSYRENDLDEMLAALSYCTEQQGDGKKYIYCLHRVGEDGQGREMSRLRKNGRFIDSPADGNKDTVPAKQQAIDQPVIILLKEKGESNIKEINGRKVELGWKSNTPFYWPVFIPQKNIPRTMFTLTYGKNSKKKRINKLKEELLKTHNIDEKDVVLCSLDYPGSEIFDDKDISDFKIHMSLIGPAIYKYLCYTENEQTHEKILQLNPNVKIKDPDQCNDGYYRNKGNFPYVIKDFKYAIVTSSDRNVALLELKDSSCCKVFQDKDALHHKRWYNEKDSKIKPKDKPDDLDIVDPKDKYNVLANSSEKVIDEYGYEDEVIYDKTIWKIIFFPSKIVDMAFAPKNEVEDDDDDIIE